MLNVQLIDLRPCHSTITATWTVGYRWRSTPTNGHRLTALGLPWWSPIQVRSRNRSSFEFTVLSFIHELFRTASPASVIKCCQLAFNFLPVNQQLDIRTANFLQKLIASENSFLLTARRKLKKLFAQFDNVTTACQFHNAILDSLTCLNVLSSEVRYLWIPSN